QDRVFRCRASVPKDRGLVRGSSAETDQRRAGGNEPVVRAPCQRRDPGSVARTRLQATVARDVPERETLPVARSKIRAVRAPLDVIGVYRRAGEQTRSRRPWAPEEEAVLGSGRQEAIVGSPCRLAVSARER